MARCLLCSAGDLGVALDLGAHPVSSFFLQHREDAERCFTIALGQCPHCGMIQLVKPLPAGALVPPYDWLVAREPEEHLDAVVSEVVALPGLAHDATIVGLTAKDDSTLERFRSLGFAKTWRVAPREDLGITSSCAGLETIQQRITPERMAALRDRRGAADVLVVRHILEHTEDPRAFLQGLAELVRPDGYMVVEVPDCSNSLRLRDYTMPWEEHSLYFTAETFADVLSLGGFRRISSRLYPLPFEGSLVQIARSRTGKLAAVCNDGARSTAGLLSAYAGDFSDTTARLRASLEHESTHGGVALYGAGHLSCAFLNFHRLADLVQFVVDDTPQKQGLFLPGARLPIVPASRLAEADITLCLLGLSIGSEDRVLMRHAPLIERGMKFRSIFAASGRSIHRDSKLAH